MILKSYEKSLFEFHSRVLYKGTPKNRNKKYTMEELKDLLKFNQIFLSNMDEFLSKYPCNEIEELYEKKMIIFHDNMDFIMKQINELEKDFEFTNDFQNEIMEEKTKESIRFFRTHPKTIFNFNHGEIYSLTLVDDKLVIGRINNNLINLPIGYHKDGFNYLWKNEKFILNYIKNKIGGESILIKPIVDYDDAFTTKKIEYFGDFKILQKLQHLFDYDTLVVRNNYLVSKYLMKLLDREKESRVKLIKNHNVNQKDLIIEYPRDHYLSFINILKKVSYDTNVEFMGICIYRISRNPELLSIISNALASGIKVTVNMELDASNEFSNQSWKEKLIEMGANVVTFSDYTGFKVHSKLILIKYKDGRYLSNISTGNYNQITSSQYTDLSLFTSDKDICKNIEKLFLLMETNIPSTFTDDLLVTQFNAKQEILNLINKESLKGKSGLICMKCNAIDDIDIITALNKAADNGCNIRLVVRGVCRWVPQQPNVEIVSYVWEKLEHSRVYIFGKYNPTIYIGSLDLLNKKIKNRIETLVKIKDNDIKNYLINYMEDYIYGEQPWVLNKDGKYRKRY